MSLTMDGLDIHDETGIFLNITRGFGNAGISVRGVDTIVPSLPGRIAHNRVADVHSLLLEGYILGSSASDFATKRDALLEKFDPTLDPAPLVADAPYYGISDTRTINVRTVPPVVEGDVVGLSNDEPYFQLISIEVESVDPNWVAT